MPGLALDDAIGLSATGDLWLFRGRSLADRAIQTVTNAPVNHVGMVVALDDLPPLLWHAELVATTYQAMGLLPSRRPASWYDPGRFWSGDRIDLVPPFALGGEIAVS